MFRKAAKMIDLAFDKNGDVTVSNFLTSVDFKKSKKGVDIELTSYDLRAMPTSVSKVSLTYSEWALVIEAMK